MSMSWEKFCPPNRFFGFARQSSAGILGGLVSTLLASTLIAQPVAEQVGFTDLQNRYGISLPDGSGVSFLLTEAGSSYYPNTAAYPGTSFIDYSGNTTVSTHSSDVLNRILPHVPGVPVVGVMSASDFVQGPTGLRFGSGFLPTEVSQNPDVRVVNASWIADFNNLGANVEVLQRLDYYVDQFGALIVGGVNNVSGSPPPITGQARNTLAVGVSTPSASSTGPSTIDTAGRAVVDLVVPEGTTSNATPYVSAAALLLMDGALSDPALNAAVDPRVVRSLLMTSAEKLPGWERGAPGPGDDLTVPLDYQFGAGELRINRAYDLMLSGEMSPGAVDRDRGWSLATLGPDSDHYFFDHSGHDLSAVLAWNREFFEVNGSTFLIDPNLDLRLWSVGAGDILDSVWDASLSLIDNVEHVFFSDLPAGRYAFEVSDFNNLEGATYSLAFMPVPEPSTWAACGLVALLVYRCHRRFLAGARTVQS